MVGDYACEPTIFRNIQMKVICDKRGHIITYTGEIWGLNKGETKKLNIIKGHVLKRIFKVQQEMLHTYKLDC